jgi:hypothetical protein
MARTSAFCSFSRLMTAALLAERQGCSADHAVGALPELTQAQTSSRMSRRQFLLGTGRPVQHLPSERSRVFRSAWLMPNHSPLHFQSVSSVQGSPD